MKDVIALSVFCILVALIFDAEGVGEVTRQVVDGFRDGYGVAQ